MSGDDGLDPPTEPSVGDEVHRLVRAAAGLFPGGGTATELLGGFLAPPIERRREVWAERVTAELRRLAISDKSIVERLQTDERFVSVVIEASSQAIRTAEAGKLEMLRAAVVNAARGEEPDDARRAMYLRYVGSLTTWHLRLLVLFRDPVEWFRKANIPLPEGPDIVAFKYVETAFPEIAQDKDFCSHLWNELATMGLARPEKLRHLLKTQTEQHPNVPDSGQRFLRFVTVDDAPSD